MKILLLLLILSGCNCKKANHSESKVIRIVESIGICDQAGVCSAKFIDGTITSYANRPIVGARMAYQQFNGYLLVDDKGNNL